MVGFPLTVVAYSGCFQYFRIKTSTPQQNNNNNNGHGHQSPYQPGTPMSDQDIRRELMENLERYESNTVLNKLTPNRRTASDLSHRSSSRRTTPGRLGRRLGHNDSNIVTSPVKTLRRYRSNTADEEDDAPLEQLEEHQGMDLDYDQPQEQRQQQPLKPSRDNITINVPLKDSPKEPMRKGTPKALSAKSSKKDTPVVIDRAPLNPQRTKNKTFTLFGDIMTLPPSESKKTKRVNNTIPDDEYDDEIDNADYARSNDTLLSDIPSDLLSPEKHIYPNENIKRKSDTSTKTTTTGSSPKKFILDSLSKSSLYPDLSAPHLTSKSNDNTPSSFVPATTTIKPLQASTVTVQTTTLNPVSPMKPSIIEAHQSSPFLQLVSRSPVQPRTQSQPPPLDRSPPPPQPPFPTLSSPRRPVRQKSSSDSPLRSPARRLAATSTTLSQSEPSNAITSTDRHSGKIDLAQFESSDEEPVPELTVAIDMNDIQDESTVMTKRVLEEEEDGEKDAKVDVGVKKRRFSIYPDFDDVEKTVEDSIKADVVNQSVLKDVQLTSLYPSLLSPIANKSIEKSDKENGQEEEQLGDADHWTNVQWARFIDLFEEFYKKDHDFSVFDDEALEFLKCDRDEILLKIAFYKEFKEEQ